MNVGTGPDRLKGIKHPGVTRNGGRRALAFAAVAVSAATGRHCADSRWSSRMR